MDNPERENIGNKTQNKTNKQPKQKHHTKMIRSETQTTQNRDELSISSSCFL
jgi:hypothetical protein